jgi:hypothetical protein
MKANDNTFKRTILIGFLLVFSFGVYAQEGSYEPKTGQAGKDVVWVPTSQVLVDKMLDMARVTPNDYVMDLGSGDGRLVISAAKRGATAVGVEYNPKLVKLSREKAVAEGLSDKAKFVNADLFKTDLTKATVITLFLLPGLNRELRPSLLELKPGTRIVSNTFDMGDWEPDEEAVVKGCGSGHCKALLWIVPAKVDGTWNIDQGELILKQKYQKISGSLNSERITGGRINGSEISFTVGENSYSGTITGNQMHGFISSENGTMEWTANLK